MSAAPARPTAVWYVEARGDALALLGDHLEAICRLPGFLGAERLSSPAQPGLGLVASRWQGPVPVLALPEGLRGWVFVVEESR